MELHRPFHEAEGVGARVTGVGSAAALFLAVVLLLPATRAAAFSWTCQSQANESCNLLTGCCGTMVCDPFAFKCHHFPAHPGELCTIYGACEDPGHYYCKGFQEGVAGRCVPYEGVGASCTPLYTLCHGPALPYAQDETCTIDLSPLLPYVVELEPGGDLGSVPWDPQVLACYPTVNIGGDLVHYGFNPGDEDDCRTGWSSTVHDEVIANGNARAYTAGLFGGVVGALSRQWGAVYGADGSYGCFEETCWGGMSTVAVGSFLSYSEYASYADFNASSYGWSVGGGEVVGVFYGRAFKGPDGWAPGDDPGLLTRVGTSVGYGTDLSVLPVSAEWMTCANEMLHEYTYDQATKRLVPKLAVALSCEDRTVCAGACIASPCAETCKASPDFGPQPVPFSQEPAGPYEIGSRTVTLAPEVEGQAIACSAVVEVFDCTPPTIQCPSVGPVECQSNGASNVVLGPPTVTDCSPYTVIPPEDQLYPLGTTTVTFVAIDGSSNQATCDTKVEVVDTQPPAIQCRPPVTVECESNRAATVLVEPPTVTDCSPYVVSPAPESKLYPLGTTPVTFVAVDGSSNQASCDTAVEVVDTQAPRILSVAATPSLLWPPDHEMRDVRIDVVAEDACGSGATCRPTAIISSEPPDATGDGSTAVDTVIVSDTNVGLRAERLGSGPGRTYLVQVECRDGAGNVSLSSATVLAPHDSSYVP